MANAAPALSPVLVRLPDHLVRLFPGAERRVELQAASVGELIDALDAYWPGMRDRICDSTPAIRRHMNVFVAGGAPIFEPPWRRERTSSS